MNLPARAARWSGRHRKVAIFGWLGFVVVAFLVGNMIGANLLTSIDQFTGESHDAEKALDDAGLRPVEEVVLLKSDTLTLDDSEFQAAAEDVTSRLGEVQYVEDVKSPLDGETEVTADRHAALVNFDDRRRLDRGQGAGRPDPRGDRRRPGRAPRDGDRAVRRRERRKGDQRDDQRRHRQGGDAVAADHADHPHDHLRLAGRRGRAAADRAHLGARRARPGRDPEPGAAAGRERQRRDPDDRPRGRGRLLALLPATRTRGARRRARRALRAGGRRRDLGAGRADLRAHRAGRDGRACSSAATRRSSRSPTGR